MDRTNGWQGLFVTLETEDILEMGQLAPPSKTYAIHPDESLEPVVGVVFVEQAQILTGILVQAILQFNVIEECIVCLLYTSDAADE